MNGTTRVRFSPAPSGSLHVGSARTALYNWLYARHHGGTFVLRIEDTDVARSRDEWVVGIQDTMRWLGLDWDEGPVLQSTRFPVYLAAADRLVEAGAAYECTCTEDEVREHNEAEMAAGRPPGYAGTCRDLTDDERAARRAAGRPRSIRFRTPDTGQSAFHDEIRGDVAVEWSTIHDFVIVRTDGTPIFYLANAVDDIDMGITIVIRGEDLLDSTHRVLALRAALDGGAPPEYAHLPLIVDAETRAKLSKRHGAVSLEELRDQGFLAEALVNYITLLGWAPADGDEVLAPGEIVAAFDLDRVTHSAAGFDRKKLEWINGEWIRGLGIDELAARLEPEARVRYAAHFDLDTFVHAVRIAQERAVTTVQILDQMAFLFVDDADFVVEPDAWTKVEATERIDEVLAATIEHVSTCDWTVDALDLRPVLSALDVKPRKAMPALYAAVEGVTAGLPLFDSLWMLGRDRAVARLVATRSRLVGA